MEVHKRERMQISFDMSKPSHAAVFHWLKNTNEPRTEIVVTAITDYIKKAENSGMANVSNSNLTQPQSFDYDLIVSKIEGYLQNSLQNYKPESHVQDQSQIHDNPEQVKKVLEQALYDVLPAMIQAAFKNVISQVMIPQISKTVTGTINKAIQENQSSNNNSDFNFGSSQLPNNPGSSFNFSEEQKPSSQYQSKDTEESEDSSMSEILADVSLFG